MVLGLGTAAFGIVGANAVTASPNEQVQILVQGEHPWNITQTTVDAALTEPIRTSVPLRIIVCPDLLTSEDLQGKVDISANVFLSTAVATATSEGATQQRFAGAAVRIRDGSTGADNSGSDSSAHTEQGQLIATAYLDNIALVHGPEAIIAAARRAAVEFDEHPRHSPIFWLIGTSIGWGATALALTTSLSRRRRREQQYRRLAAAQYQLVAVVLQLESLEITYLATPLPQRTAGFTETWQSIHRDSLAIARTEDTVVEAVSRRKTSLNAETALLVEDFETRAAALTSKAQALLGAGSVLAKLDGGQRVLDRLAPPMTLAARALLARLDRLPNGRTKRKPIREVELALTRKLEVLNQTGDDDEQPADWHAAECSLERSATTVTGSLMRGRRFGPDVPLVDREDQSSLRTELGLQADGSERVLKALDEAIATVKMRFGALDFDFKANVSDSPSTVGTPNTKSEPDKQGVAGLLETLAQSRKAFHRAQPRWQATASGSNPMWGSSTSTPLPRMTLLSWSAVLLIVSFTLSMMILAGKSRPQGQTPAGRFSSAFLRG